MASTLIIRTQAWALSIVLFLSCLTWVQVLPAEALVLHTPPTINPTIPKRSTINSLPQLPNLTTLQRFDALRSQEVVQESALKNVQTTVDRFVTERVTNTITINSLNTLPRTSILMPGTTVPTQTERTIIPDRLTTATPGTLTPAPTAPRTAPAPLLTPLPSQQVTKLLAIPNINRQYTAFINTGLSPMQIMQTTQDQIHRSTALRIDEIARQTRIAPGTKP